MFFLCGQGPFTKIDHILVHKKVSINIKKDISIHRLFIVHNGIKLEINNRKTN